jgi:ribosomal protein L37AE/L43A
LGDLRRITGLPETFGRHACEERGHPQMRRFPDGIFHCPACGSEVLPAKAFWRQG